MTMSSWERLWVGMRGRLVRITTGGEYLPEVDGVRFLAISLVLLQHMYERVSRRAEGIFAAATGEDPGWWFLRGDLGVQLFFALSGFILFRGLAQTAATGTGWAEGYRRYLFRRLTRLEPPYLLVTLGIFGFLALTGYQSGFSRSSQQGGQTLLQSLGASLIYSHTLLFGSYPKLNPPTWSLETEFQFYLFAPWVVWPLRRWLGTRLPRLIVLALSIAGAGLFLVPHALAGEHWSHSAVAYLPLFLAGFAAGELHEWNLQSRMFPRTRGVVLDLLGVVAGGVLLRVAYNDPASGGVVGYALWIMILLLGCTGGTWLRRILGWGFIPVIGGMCYSLYLIHLPFLEMAASATRSIGRQWSYPAFVAVQGTLLLGSTLAVAAAFYVLVERPCMDRRWPNRIWAWCRRLPA